MKAEVINKMSTYIYYLLIALSAVAFAMFYFVGYDNQTQIAGNIYTDPQNLDVLLYWMYILVCISIVSVAIFVVVKFIAKLKSEPKSALKSLGAALLLVVLFIGAYCVADDSPITVNGEMFEDKDLLVLTDVAIYVQYVLMAVTVLCTVISLLGVFKSVNKIKA